jgi:hypothetical protein
MLMRVVPERAARVGDDTAFAVKQTGGKRCRDVYAVVEAFAAIEAYKNIVAILG